MFKWVCGGLGWVFGGPVFGVTGFIAGTVIDSLKIRKSEKKEKTVGVFATGILSLIAAVMKAEIPVLKTEVIFVRRFLKMNFGEEDAGDALVCLKEILKKDIQLEEVCNYIRSNLDYSSRLQLMHFLFNLAEIDGRITAAEQAVLNIIVDGLKVKSDKKQYVRTSVDQNYTVSAAYKILCVNSDASIINIKKAYRKLAVECHPDKVAHLGEEQKKAANEKFLQVMTAYNIIKKERNFT